MPFEGFQRHTRFKFCAVAFPLCRHLSSPPQSYLDTAFYLNHLSSFRGTLYWLMVGGRVRKRRCLGEGPMTGWLWQPGRGTTKLYNTPTPQIGADRCMQKSLPVGTFLNRTLPSIGRGLNSYVLAPIRPTTMTLSTRCSGVGILTR